MNPAVILAAIDAGITVYERAMKLLAEAQAEGLITVQEQQERIDRVKALGSRVGVEVIDPPASGG